MPGRATIVVTALLAALACGGEGDEPTVRPGLEVFLAEPPEVALGKRIGLITSDASVDRRGRRGVDLLADHPRLDVVALFAFEHGLGGEAPPGAEIGEDVDPATGLPVHSLYGETRRPTHEMLDGIELLAYDVRDSGSRTYTRVSTMALSMQAAAGAGIPFLVLDRPNPIRGDIVEGPVLDPAFSSFVGMYPIALRHGMTVGELARMYDERHGIGVDLHVVPAAGWRRGMWFDETGLPWRAPSPNLPRLEAVIHYPGTVLVEGTNLSEGRGTERPFEQVGAPWLRADAVAAAMNARELPGVRFSAARLEIAPDARKYGGETIPGVRMTLTDRDRYRPVRTTLRLLETVRRLHPRDFGWRGGIDRLAGTDRVREAVDAGRVGALLREMEAGAAAFRERREPYLLYPGSTGPRDSGAT